MPACRLKVTNFAQNWLPYGNVPWGIEKKLIQIDNIQTNTFHLMKKIMKIGPVAAEIPLLNLKQRNYGITEGKPGQKYAELANKFRSKFTARCGRGEG